MKVFYAPVIDGQFAANQRMKDRTDNEAYAIVEQMLGPEGTDTLDDHGYVKVLDRNPDGEIKGRWTYQQDDL